MRSTSFSQFWNSIFSGSLPLMYLLCEEKRDQWVRFYSLPEGNRYPSDESEEEEILKRYNCAGGAVFNYNEALWLVSDVDVDKSSTSQILKLLGTGFKSTGIKSYIDHDGDKCRSRFFYKQDHWNSGAFNDLFSLVFNEKISGILFINQKAELFYVYAGGIDVILPDTDRLDHIKRQFKQWRSPLLSGL